MATTNQMEMGARAAAGGRGRKGGGSRALDVILWILQVLVALLFLYAGWVKLSMPLEALAKVSPVPGPLLKFVAACEVLGAIGLIVPWLTGIRPGLTPLAAAGLVIIMVGAVVSTLATMPASWAVLPLAVGVAAAFIAYGRWRLTPRRRSSRAMAGT